MIVSLFGLLTLTVLTVLYSRRDPVTLLTVLLALLMLISARWVVGPLGAIGSPALLVGLLAMVWWLVAVVVPSVGLPRGSQPVRWIVLGYAWYIAVGYVIAHSKPLTALQISSSDREMITLASMCGVALLAADGIQSRNRLDALLKRLVWLGGIFALFGVLQFLFGFDLVSMVDFPGLVQNQVDGVGDRSGFARSASTAMHAIEFSVVLCMLLPLSVHYAMRDPDSRHRKIAWVCVALLGMGIPMSISRTGVLSAVAALTFMFAIWSWKRRLRAAVAIVAFASVLYVLIPGLLGTVLSLFEHVNSDPSINARVERGPRALELWSENFWFGMGTSTFTLDDYFLLDVQYYVTAIEHGIVGIAVLIGLIIAGVWLATQHRRRGADDATVSLGYALAAPLAVVMVSLATFDALFYRILTTVLFLFIGCAGALWRLERERTSQTHVGVPMADVPGLVGTRR